MSQVSSILTLTSEYALRAVVYLADQGGKRVSGTQIAKEADVPSKYLSRILADLVRARVLDSTRGKGGGFQLAKDAKEIPLFDILSHFEPVFGNRRPCPFGHEVCSDDTPCGGHEQWKMVRAAYEKFLHQTNVSDVSGVGTDRE